MKAKILSIQPKCQPTVIKRSVSEERYDDHRHVHFTVEVKATVSGLPPTPTTEPPTPVPGDTHTGAASIEDCPVAFQPLQAYLNTEKHLAIVFDIPIKRRVFDHAQSSGHLSNLSGDGWIDQYTCHCCKLWHTITIRTYGISKSVIFYDHIEAEETRADIGLP